MMRLMIHLALSCALALATSEGNKYEASFGSLAGNGNTTTLHTCLTAIGAKLAPVFPGDANYDNSRKTFNGRVVRSPAAVFYANSAQDVSKAVQCARDAGIKVTPASGRQSFSGEAIQDGYLVVDVSAINNGTISADNKTVTVGPGMSGAMFQAFMYDSGIKGAEVPSGYCSWVGVGGFTLGGGMGPAGRLLGLACDSLLGVEMVLYNGTIVHADENEHPDLLWASCGGGGGTFGVVTALKFKISILPNEGQLTIIQVRVNRTKTQVLNAINRLQDWIPHMDRKYGIDALSFGGGLSGPWLMLHGVYFGPKEEALEGLKEAGLLDDLDERWIAMPENSDLHEEYPRGLVLQGNKTMYDFYYETAKNWSSITYSLASPWMASGVGPVDSGWRNTKEHRDYLHDLMRGKSPHGPVVGGQYYHGSFLYSQSRIVGRLDNDTIEAMLSTFETANAACRLTNVWDVSAANLATTNFSSACGYISLGHVLGGAYWDKAPNETAFPHRDAYFVLAGQSYVPDIFANRMTSNEVARAYEEVDGFLRALEPDPLHHPEHAYVNYFQPDEASFPNWQHGYFGDNYEQLLEIKQKYDPEGQFTKPMGVGAAAITARRLHYPYAHPQHHHQQQQQQQGPYNARRLRSSV